MKPTLLTVPLASLASSPAFGQKFQDVAAKGGPVSLGVKHDYADMDPYAAVRNNSSKAILAMEPTNTEVSSVHVPIWITPLKSARWLLRKGALPPFD